MKQMKFPTAFTIIFLLIAVVAVMTWIVPAGEYDRAMNEALGREAPIPGTYHEVAPNPQGLTSVILAPIAGMYDPSMLGSSASGAIDVALFILVIGGFLAVVTRTGAIDAGIGWLLGKLQGREILMIPILMIAFAAGGTSFGMAEETLAFYALIIPVFLRAGYDTLTAVAVILLGAGLGTMGSTFNAFATVVASNGAGIPFTDGIVLRAVILAASLGVGIAYVMHYARRVQTDPSQSLVADRREDYEKRFLHESSSAALPDMTRTRGVIMALFAATFGIMIYGVVSLGWWMGEMSGLFLTMSIIVWWIGKTHAESSMDEETFVDTFVDGAKDLLGVALIVAVARGVVVVMDAGKITDTILASAEGFAAGLSEVLFINGMFGIETAMSFLVPSSSGLATLTMPIMAPLADFAGVDRSLVVTAYQSANGWVNLFSPTTAVVMGGIAIGGIPYDRWIRFLLPLLVILAVIIMTCLSIGTIAG